MVLLPCCRLGLAPVSPGLGQRGERQHAPTAGIPPRRQTTRRFAHPIVLGPAAPARALAPSRALAAVVGCTAPYRVASTQFVEIGPQLDPAPSQTATLQTCETAAVAAVS